MNDKQSILAKIKKCMALSSSSNEHEAAAALRQAQKLMQTHNLSMTDIENSKITEAISKSTAQVTPPEWETDLAWLVARAFGCVWYFLTYKGYSFVGYETSSEIAGYVFEVLIRQAKKSRKDFISKLGRTTRTNKTKSADFFMTGWVNSVHDLISNTYNINKNNNEILMNYVNSICKDSDPLKTNNRTDNGSCDDWDAFHKGVQEGKNASLNQAVTGSCSKQLSIGATNV